MKAILAVALLVFGGSSYGQGTINFNNRFAVAGVNAPIEKDNITFAPLGPAYAAALYLVEGNTAALLPTSVTRFREPSPNPLSGKYIVPVLAEVPGRGAGDIVTVRMRVWLAAAGSYETAPFTERGESWNLTVTLGGGPIPPGDLPSTFTGFWLYQAPEPQTWAIFLAGGIVFALTARRRAAQNQSL